MEEFIGVLSEMTAVFTELSNIGNVKLTCAKDQRIATLEECLTKEQAISMRLRGLEQKRERLQEEMGFQGLTFTQMSERLSEEQKKKVMPYFDMLSREIQMFQIINDNVEKVININMRQIKKELEKRGESETVNTPNTTYKPFTDKKV